MTKLWIALVSLMTAVGTLTAPAAFAVTADCNDCLVQEHHGDEHDDDEHGDEHDEDHH